MTKAIAQTYNVVHSHRIGLTYGLMAGCLLAILMYGLNIYSLVSRSIAIQHVKSEISTVSTAVSVLDSQYLTLSSRVTPEAMKLGGWSQGHVTEYIDKSASLGRVALTGHEL